MKTRTIFVRPAALLILLAIAGTLQGFSAPKEKQMYYELKIYRIGGPTQESRIDSYLKDAFIPAMHRAGIPTIGVFKPIEKDTAFGKMVYVFIPYKTVDEYAGLEAKLAADKAYQEAGKQFLDAPYNDPPFYRYESVFMKAFAYMPRFKVYSYNTPMNERIYEIRSYESATEAKAAKKIQMFNEGGEIGIFEKVGSNAVFYGQVLFGSKKPRLIYMTTYADMKSHDDHWKAFRESPDWKTLSGMEEYKNSTSKTLAYLCHPASYSDF